MNCSSSNFKEGEREEWSEFKATKQLITLKIEKVEKEIAGVKEEIFQISETIDYFSKLPAEQRKLSYAPTLKKKLRKME